MTKKNAQKIAARARQTKLGGKYLHHRRIASGGGAATSTPTPREDDFDDTFVPEEIDLRSEEPHVAEMVAWFFTTFEDPANGVPFESAEGGYQYILGGPYDAREELADGFDADYERFLDRAVDIVESYCTDWVKRGQY